MAGRAPAGRRAPGPAPALELRWSGSHRRREPLNGLVMLALLAILCAYLVTRVMRRIGLGMSRNNTFGLMFVFVVVVLMLWGQTIK
jgi:hypothetical protein